MPHTTAPTAPDLRPYLRIHRCLRASATQLATATALPADRSRRRALQRWYQGFAAELRCHHHIEDTLLFPALAARVATYGEHAPRLAADHDTVDVLLADLAAALADGPTGDPASAARLAGALRDHLDEHLGYEDDEVAPLFARHFSGPEFDELNTRAVRMTSPRQLVFTAPWLLAQLDAEEQAEVLASVPRALHLLWFATRRGYARLCARAFAGT